MMWLFLLGSAAGVVLSWLAARWVLFPRARSGEPTARRRRSWWSRLRGGDDGRGGRHVVELEPADPLVTLELQTRLSELADELRRIERDPDLYARAHHYLAVQGAYDALLREACRLTGLPVEASPLRAGFRTGDEERFREELELSARGWSW